MTTGYGSTTVWLVFLAAGVGTYALRGAFIFLLGAVDEVPATVHGVLRYVPPAVLAALVVPAVVSLSLDPSLGVAFELEKVIAASAAAVVAWRTESVLGTIGVGMVVFWGLGSVL